MMVRAHGNTTSESEGPQGAIFAADRVDFDCSRHRNFRGNRKGGNIVEVDCNTR